MATAAVRRETGADIEYLLRQWRSVMASSRPRWSTADLTFTQLRALSAIARRGSMRVSELADELGIGLAAGSSLADRMVQRRFQRFSAASIGIGAVPQEKPDACHFAYEGKAAFSRSQFSWAA